MIAKGSISGCASVPKMARTVSNSAGPSRPRGSVGRAVWLGGCGGRPGNAGHGRCGRRRRSFGRDRAERGHLVRLSLGGADLQAAPVHFHDGQLRRRLIGRRVFTLGQRRGQVGNDGAVAFGLTLVTDALRQTLDLLGRDRHLRQYQQVLAAALEGRVVAAGVDDLLEQTRTETAPVNAQALRLREKKPCDRVRNGWRVLASRPCRCGPGRSVVRGRGPGWACHRWGSVVKAPGGVARPDAGGLGGVVRC